MKKRKWEKIQQQKVKVKKYKMLILRSKFGFIKIIYVIFEIPF